MAAERELTALAACPSWPLDADCAPEVSAQLDVLLDQRSEQLRSELMTARQARTADAFEAEVGAWVGSTRLAALPSTSGIVTEARGELERLRSQERLAAEERSRQQRRALAAVEERQRAETRQRMLAHGPDADALGPALAFNYLNSHPRRGLIESTNLLQRTGNQVRFNFFGVEQNDSFNVRNVSCRRAGQAFDCSYEFEFQTAMNVFGLNNSASSGWISRRDRFVPNGETWSSTSLEQGFRSIREQRLAEGAASASSSRRGPDPGCTAARMGMFGRGAGVAMGIGACNAFGN